MAKKEKKVISTAKVETKAIGKQKKTEKNDEQKEEINWVKEIIEMVLYIAFVIVVVWLVITFVGQRTEVSGSSMYDTLEDGDNLWVDKFTYHFKDPKRYDIVVFPYTEGDGTEVFYIKRIIGLPGETVQIDEDGTININGKPIEGDIYGYETIVPNMIGRADEPVELSDDEYFVMGDNRNDSKDSRFSDVGSIEKDRLAGKAVYRIWPLSKFGKIEKSEK